MERPQVVDSHLPASAVMSWSWLPTDEYDPVKGCALFFISSYSIAGSIDATDDRAHDKGIIRASRAFYDYTRDPKITGDPKTTILFSRMAHDTIEDSIRSFFIKFGSIRRLQLVRHLVTGASRGYGFLEYEKESEARSAFYGAQRAVIDGRQLMVDLERERTMDGWVPRRLGGGLGGRKESGQLRFGGRDRPFKKPFLASTPAAQWALQMMNRGRPQYDARAREYPPFDARHEHSDRSEARRDERREDRPRGEERQDDRHDERDRYAHKRHRSSDQGRDEDRRGRDDRSNRDYSDREIRDRDWDRGRGWERDREYRDRKRDRRGD